MYFRVVKSESDREFALTPDGIFAFSRPLVGPLGQYSFGEPKLSKSTMRRLIRTKRRGNPRLKAGMWIAHSSSTRLQIGCQTFLGPALQDIRRWVGAE